MLKKTVKPKVVTGKSGRRTRRTQESSWRDAIMQDLTPFLRGSAAAPAPLEFNYGPTGNYHLGIYEDQQKILHGRYGSVIEQ